MKTQESIGKEIVDAAMAVHRELGPGLLESTYELCLVQELSDRGIRCDAQKALPVHYKGIKIESGYRLDLLVENLVIVELKAVQELLPVHQAQILSYLKLSKLHLGYLINFNTILLKNGLKRVVLGADDYANTSRTLRSSRFKNGNIH